MHNRGVVIGLLMLGVTACGPRKREPEVKPGVFALLSNAFQDGNELPRQFTCDGDGISPPMRWVNPPAGTKSYVLTLSDPDGPMGTYRHWGAYNIPVGRSGVGAGDGLPSSAAFDQVINSKEERQYLAPCPPPGGGAHHYVFKLIALGKPTLEIGDETGVGGLESAASGSKLGEATLTVTYERK